MGILELLLPPGLQPRRQLRVLRQGSPPFVWEPGAIAATATSAIYLDSQFPASRKYAPLDLIEIVNNDSVDIDVFINGTEQRHVPAGVIRTIDDDIGIRHVTVENLDTATASTAGKIVLTFQKKAATLDSLVRSAIR